MKRIILVQAKSWCGLLLAGWLLAGLASTGRADLFAGDLGTNNWVQIPVGDNDGGFVFTGVGDTVILYLTSSATPGFSDTLLGLTSPYLSAPEVVNLSWTLSANGNVGQPQAYFYVDTLQYALTIPSGSLTNILIPANTPVYFELLGDVTAGKSSAQLELSGVPEPENLMAGLLMVAAGFEWFRRKRKAGG